MEAGNVPTQTKDCAALVRAFHLWPRLWSPDVGRPQSRTSSGGKPGCRVPGTAVRLRPREEGSVAGRRSLDLSRWVGREKADVETVRVGLGAGAGSFLGYKGRGGKPPGAGCRGNPRTG